MRSASDEAMYSPLAADTGREGRSRSYVTAVKRAGESLIVNDGRRAIVDGARWRLTSPRPTWW